MKKKMEFEIKFANGTTIKALTANPGAARGWGGKIEIDSLAISISRMRMPED